MLHELGKLVEDATGQWRLVGRERHLHRLRLGNLRLLTDKQAEMLGPCGRDVHGQDRAA